MTDDPPAAGDTGHVSVLESMEITAEAQEEYDECPECGEDYIDLDTTLTGTLVFIHQESPIKDCTLQTEPKNGGETDD